MEEQISIKLPKRDDYDLVPVYDIDITAAVRKEFKGLETVGDKEGLIDSIKRIGLLQPIVLNNDNRLIAGRRRLEAFRRMGIPEIPAVYVNYENFSSELQAQNDENTQREPLSIAEAIALKKMLEPIYEEEKAKAKAKTQFQQGNQVAKKEGIAKTPTAQNPPKDDPSSPKNGSANFAEPFLQEEKPNQATKEKKKPAPQTREVASQPTGFSHTSLTKAEVIQNAAERNPQRYGHLWEAINSNDENKQMPVHKAYIEYGKLKDQEDQEERIKNAPDRDHVLEMRSHAIKVSKQAADAVKAAKTALKPVIDILSNDECFHLTIANNWKSAEGLLRILARAGHLLECPNCQAGNRQELLIPSRHNAPKGLCFICKGFGFVQSADWKDVCRSFKPDELAKIARVPLIDGVDPSELDQEESEG